MGLITHIRHFVTGVFFLTASILLFLGLVMILPVGPGGYNQSTIEKVLPVVFICVGLLLLGGIAWILSRQRVKK